jgi:hypothetical protein
VLTNSLLKKAAPKAKTWEAVLSGRATQRNELTICFFISGIIYPLGLDVKEEIRRLFFG